MVFTSLGVSRVVVTLGSVWGQFGSVWQRVSHASACLVLLVSVGMHFVRTSRTKWAWSLFPAPKVARMGVLKGLG